MAQIALRASTSAELVLFERFGYALIYFLEKKNFNEIKRPEFFTYMLKYTGVNERKWGEDFGKKTTIFLEEEAYLLFCQNFQKAYDSLSPHDKRLYADIRALFDVWKATLDKRRGTQEKEEGIFMMGDLSPFPEDLIDSKWHSYALHSVTTSPVISRMAIEIGKVTYDNAEVTLTHWETAYGTWRGTAHITKDYSLVMNISKTTNDRGYTYFMFPLSTVPDHHKLLVGHCTYKNNSLDTAVTKVTLLERCYDYEVHEARKYEIGSDELPDRFSEFLTRKEFQPMYSTQASKIYSHETLLSWLNEKSDVEF